MISIYLVFGIAIALTVVWVVQFWQDAWGTLKAPVVQVSARVITTYSGHAGGFQDTDRGQVMIRYAVFELENGTRKNFAIGRWQLTEGATGLLTYQGRNFIGFNY